MLFSTTFSSIFFLSSTEGDERVTFSFVTISLEPALGDCSETLTADVAVLSKSVTKRLCNVRETQMLSYNKPLFTSLELLANKANF